MAIYNINTDQTVISKVARPSLLVVTRGLFRQRSCGVLLQLSPRNIRLYQLGGLFKILLYGKVANFRFPRASKGQVYPRAY